jgi:excisionase family DNA binding protein
MTNQTVGRLAYSIREAAAALGISEASAYKLIQRGQLPTVIIGRKRFVDASLLRVVLAGKQSVKV